MESVGEDIVIMFKLLCDFGILWFCDVIGIKYVCINMILYVKFLSIFNYDNFFF